MKPRKNILWIMCDQLRYDYLSCYGHPTLQTPNIDQLAERGVRFSNAYVQSPVCGPSRMSAYTGRYMRSHGATQNGIPLRVGEPTLGEHLADVGMRCVLIGKTHMQADLDGMQRLGINPQSQIGVRAAQCGFEPFERDDGLHPASHQSTPAYHDFLRAHGFDADSPWEYWANSADGDNGEDLSGWLLAHADRAARIPERFSETAYMTQRAIDFIEEASSCETPWCAHLSYIKPHWPYMAPAPYHQLYAAKDVLPAVRSAAELQTAHPLYKAFTELRFSRNFSRDEVRAKVIPAYMGLIKQIDDQLGSLFDFLRNSRQFDNTVIVFTSDHGDYLGDHWLGEKYLFHDVSAKVPMIIHDPSVEADATRGSCSDALVEMIDLAPTFIELAGGRPPGHILEGQSLLPLLRNPDGQWPRDYAFSELDYADEPPRLALGQQPADCRATMVFDGRFKLVDCVGLAPMLFDLASDPAELIDRGRDPALAAERSRLLDAINQWYRRACHRITLSDDALIDDDDIRRDGDVVLLSDVRIGYRDEHELRAERQRLATILAARQPKPD